MTTPWMPSPYGTPTPVIDAVMHTPTQGPIPIPGLVPLTVSHPFAGAPPVPVMAVQPPMVPFPVVQQPYYPFGVQTPPAPFLMVQQQPVFYPFAVQQQPIPSFGMQQPVYPFGMQQPIAYPFGVQPTVASTAGIQPLPIHQMGMQQPLPVQAWAGQHALTPGMAVPPVPLPIPGQGGAPVSPITAILLSQLGLREAASRIGDEGLKGRIITGVNEALDRTIEGLSAMTLQPWFGPGAQSMIYPIVSELALLAQRYQDGALRNDLLTLAGQILHKSIIPTAEGAGGKRR